MGTTRPLLRLRYALRPYGVAPGPGYVWMGGYWGYRGNAYAWVPGRWAVPPRPHAAWAPGYWEHHGGRYRFHEGRWR